MNALLIEAKKYKAAIWTIGVHILLLILVLLIRYQLPVREEMYDMGMEVNLGTSLTGYGSDQPENPNDPSAMSVVTAGSRSQSDNNNDIHTTDDPDAPDVNINPNNNRNNTNTNINNRNRRNNTNNTVNNNNNNQTANRQINYTFPNSNGEGGNRAQNQRAGSNEGITDGDGDQGVIGGSVGAANYVGIPGHGGKYRLGNRRMVATPEKEAEFTKGGSVKVNITVDKKGNIIRHSIVSARHEELRKLANEAIKKIKFNEAPNAPAEQTGDIIFEFKAVAK